MKIAVYAISLNEASFVARWAKSAKEADYIVLADSGSTDDTVKIAKKHGVVVHSISVRPWRFDDARNASLALVPDDADYCIALDLDEILLPGWREELETAFKQNITRPRYSYTWSWKPDGTPGLQYGGDKIHARHGYRWKHPVHEVLVADRITEVQGWTKLEIHHHPDETKSRGQYLSLLELSVREDPWDDRNAYYYARELYFAGQYEAATKEFKRHLSLPGATWKPERAASLRYLAKTDTKNAQGWLQQAVKEDPSRREAWVELALLYYTQRNWEDCLRAAESALQIQEKPLDYLCEEFAWGAIPYDLAAIASYHRGDYPAARSYGEQAILLAPEDKRLVANLAFYRGA